jgi:syntaxin 18
MLRALNMQIRQLADAESVRQSTASNILMKKRAQKGLGGFVRWANGGAMLTKTEEEKLQEGKEEAVKIHREGVIWYLQTRLGEAGRYQAEMMEVRLSREVEKSKSILYKVRGDVGMIGGDWPADVGPGISAASGHSRGPSMGGPRGGYRNAGGVESEEGRHIEQQLSEEQLSLFAQENNDMLKQYEDTLDQVRYVKDYSYTKSFIEEILGLQSAHWWRFPNFKPLWHKIWPCNLPILIN